MCSLSGGSGWYFATKHKAKYVNLNQQEKQQNVEGLKASLYSYMLLQKMREH